MRKPNMIGGMRVIESPFLPEGEFLLFDPSLLQFTPELIKPRNDGLCSDEFDVSKVPEFHRPFHLVSQKIELFPADRYRLNNELIDIFGTVELPRGFIPCLGLNGIMAAQNPAHFIICAEA